MGITIGSKLGPYEIVSLIGAGGMGEVYRAHDTRLKREVAIKILSDNGFSNNEVKKRFQFEARTASSLNHPNIVAIYDVGGENEKPYIVSELVEGDNLRKLLAKGPLPIRIVLDIAVQIADGLSAAHRAGIVHRDLKPENIMITGQGHVKILDFGLAKLRMDVETEGQTQTLSRPLSEAGMRHGTVPYMSPEQASGEQLDYRSDQFSFGCILYEMATGKCAFLKESAPRTLAAILSEEPTPISELNARVPAPVRWVIDRCLSKEPKQRYDSTVDLHRELRHLRDHLSEAITTDKIFPLQPPPHNQRRNWIFFAIAMIVGLASIIWLRQKETPKLDLESYRYIPFETGPGRQSSSSWSADGKAIVFISHRQVFTRNLDSFTSAQITHSESPCSSPFWSPDGTRIYYISDYKGKPALWRISAAGGKADLLLENVTSASVSLRDGTLALLRTDNGSISLWSAGSSGEQPRKIMPEALAIKKFVSGQAKFSPDGSKIGLLGIDATETGEFWVIPYPNGKPQQYLQNVRLNNSGFNWLPNNQEIVYSRKNLWIADLKKNSERAITAARGPLDLQSQPAVSPDGKTIVFQWFNGSWDLFEIPLDGSPTKQYSTAMHEGSPMWSPRGQNYVYVTDRRGISEIWINNRKEGTEQPIVTGQHFGAESEDQILDSPAFSPDGQRIAFQRAAGLSVDQAIWLTTLAGGRPVRLTKRNDSSQDGPTWSPDGAWIAYCLQVSPADTSLAKARAGVEQDQIILRKGAVYYKPVWSPKGDWITFQSQEGLSLVSPDGKKIKMVSPKHWGGNCWSKDGSILYGMIREGDRWLLKKIILAGREEKTIRDLGSIEDNSPNFVDLSLNEEEQAFLTSISTAGVDLWMLQGF